MFNKALWRQLRLFISQRFLDGNPTTQFPIRTVPRFITSHPDYLWLNRLQCVSIGEGNLDESYAAYDVYALR